MGKRLQTVAMMTCMKTLLMLFNFVFWVTGIIILAVGIWMKVELHKYMELSTEFSSNASYILIGTGALVILIGSLACCCTAKGQPALLYIYATFLFIMVALELGGGVSLYAYRNKLQEGFASGINYSIHHYTVPKDPQSSHVDFMQSHLQCCGELGYEDWFNTSYRHVPISCCKEVDHACDTSQYELINHKGCYQKIVDFLNENMGHVAACAVGIAFFPAVGIILACCLARNINRAKYEQMA
ncbi:tetraspanin-7-like [Ischnura elegans]|uniref:tetraspanin-7-like n=1 Tax=Ischnura elegans TaxID=197161 RepID=UPI001ED86EA2|nr:tetraspanin-7-like [Ischnura elegans]